MKKRRRKKKLRIFLFFCLIILIVIFSFAIFFLNKDNIEEKEKSNIVVSLVDNLELEVNSDIDVKSLISNIENGSMIGTNEKVDTSNLGKKDITIKLKNEEGKEEKYTFEVIVVDNEKPKIEAEDSITIYVGDEVDLLEYVTVTDNFDKEFDVKVEGTYDNSKKGEYKLSYVVKDSSNNESKKEFMLIVDTPKYRRMSDKTITTSKGYTLKIRNGLAYIDDILIVNKTYYLPENYKTVDSYSALSDNCVTCLNKDVMSAYNEMKSETVSLGLNIWLASGFRSYSVQNYLYNSYIARDGVEAADTYSARPGHSEHQTGLAFDLNSVSSAFAYTDEGKWIKDNCYRYGFIIRYPEGKESITGYMYESWHLRYVGKELAEKLYNNGDWITLEEYFGITSKYED